MPHLPGRRGRWYDLLQEMILQLWLAYGSFRGESKISSWTYRVAIEQLAVFYKAVQQLEKVEKALLYLYMENQPYEELSIFTILFFIL